MALSKIQAESMNLADTYAFTGTVSGAGKMELISSDTTGASNVAYSDITLSQDTDYHHQILVVNGYYHSSVAETGFRLIEGGSAISASGSYHCQRIGKKDGVNTNGSSNQSYTDMRVNWYSPGDSSSEPSDIFIKIFNSTSSSLRTTIHVELNGFATDAKIATNYANAIRLASAVAEGIRLRAASGNISYANYALYGVKL